MRQSPVQVSAARRRPGDRRPRTAAAATAHARALTPPACGHTRYTKGCDICALAGIYRDHLSRPGITPAERKQVVRLFQAGDKAGLFKLWQARPDASDRRESEHRTPRAS